MRWASYLTRNRGPVYQVICIKPEHAELDLLTAPRLRTRLLDLAVPAEVLVDMSDVELCDAAGIAALLAGWKRQWAAGGMLQLAGTRPYVEHILTVAGAMHVFARPASD